MEQRWVAPHKEKANLAKGWKYAKMNKNKSGLVLMEREPIKKVPKVVKKKHNSKKED